MRRSRGPRPPRATTAVAVAVLAAATVAGCTGDKKPETKADTSTMNTIATDIQTKLAQRPDVTKAEVVYQDNITVPGSTSVSVMVKPGSNLDPVVDDALRLVWTSKLNPLKTIDLGVTDSKTTSGASPSRWSSSTPT